MDPSEGVKVEKLISLGNQLLILEDQCKIGTNQFLFFRFRKVFIRIEHVLKLEEKASQFTRFILLDQLSFLHQLD